MTEKLFCELCALEQVEALALGGSRAGEHFDAASDYDVYLYCTAPIPEAVRRDILSKYCGRMEIGNHFWEYEDNCVLNDGVDIDLLYRDLDELTAGVARVVEQFQPQNGYTTCMWHNLLTCKVLYDRDGRLTAARARFDVPYPPQLRQNIMENSWRLLHSALPAYEGQIKKALKRGDLVSVSHRTAAFLEAYFDFLFALNGVTHPGEKRLVQLCRERCKLLPRRFEENLERLFQDMFRDPAGTAADLEDILAELKILA
ncbi:DUF4037 domain-containing protein [Oscillospiraceae bacterium 44-34]